MANVNGKGQTAEQAYQAQLAEVARLVAEIQQHMGSEFGMVGKTHDWSHVGTMALIKSQLLEVLETDGVPQFPL